MLETTWARFVDLVIADQHYTFYAAQKRAEILALLEALRAERPVRLCEIGTSFGGTLFLLSRVAAPNARILSLDLNYTKTQLAVFPVLIGARQRITCLARDSHSQDTLQEVKDWLAGEKFDFLFIDGDHSFDGAKSDVEMYCPLVKSGGLVAMHDIQPDFKTRFGVQTGNSVGEVPRLWESLKDKYPHQRTAWIEDPEQDGYGIGSFRWMGEVR